MEADLQMGVKSKFIHSFCKLDCLNTLEKIVYNNEMAHLTKKLHKFTPKILFYWSLVHQHQKAP